MLSPGKVVAIALDSAEPKLLERWMNVGELPTLARLRDEAMCGRVSAGLTHRAETPWAAFLTGKWPDESGEWGAYRFSPADYGVRYMEAGTGDNFVPFYTFAGDRRVAVFDMPKTQVQDGVNGIQVTAWGTHAPDAESRSLPPELYNELQELYGPHPVGQQHEGDWWDANYLRHIQTSMRSGVERRADIACDLLNREDWDLSLMAFSETHVSGHAFWHLSQADHPLYGIAPNPLGQGDPLLQVYREVDAALGRVLGAVPADTTVLLYSVHGMGANIDEVPSIFFLGEVLYRLQYPGRHMFARSEPGSAIPSPVLCPRRNNWTSAIWCERDDSIAWRRWIRQHAPNATNGFVNRFFGCDHPPDLASPNELRREGNPMFWEPVTWYRRFWSQMKAFALPGFTGQIRINLAGRESQGIVQPEDYQTTCDWVEQELSLLVNPRTGHRAVHRVRRTRETGMETDPHLPDADLVLEWADEPMDMIESSTIGRIGPVPFRRTGSHRSGGCYFLKSPGLEPGEGPEASVVDLAPTLLDLMGADVPSGFSGRPLALVHA